MKLVISEVQNPVEAVFALGLKSLAAGMGASVDLAGIVIGGGIVPEPAVVHDPALALPAPAASTPKRRESKSASRALAKKTAAHKTARKAPAASDPRGSKRDAIRASLRSGPKPVERILADAQKTFPELDRNYVGLVLLQLSRAGECELGEDKLWRAAA